MAAKLKLRQGEVLRGVFHQNDHGPGNPDPTGSIEEFPNLPAAEAAFLSRASNRGSLAYYVGEEAQWTDWPDGDRTAYMDVWVAEPDPDEEPGDIMTPDCYDQRWTAYGSGIRREPF